VGVAEEQGHDLAALAVGAAWCKPVFTVDRGGKKLTDFNDLAALEGAQVVTSQIQQAIAKIAGAGPTLSQGFDQLGERPSAVPILLHSQQRPQKARIVAIELGSTASPIFRSRRASYGDTTVYASGAAVIAKPDERPEIRAARGVQTV
jgi:hypothetical protein